MLAALFLAAAPILLVRYLRWAGLCHGLFVCVRNTVLQRIRVPSVKAVGGTRMAGSSGGVYCLELCTLCVLIPKQQFPWRALLTIRVRRKQTDAKARKKGASRTRKKRGLYGNGRRMPVMGTQRWPSARVDFCWLSSGQLQLYRRPCSCRAMTRYTSFGSRLGKASTSLCGGYKGLGAYA